MSTKLIKESPNEISVLIIASIVIGFFKLSLGIIMAIAVLLRDKILIYDDGRIEIQRMGGFRQSKVFNKNDLIRVDVSRRVLRCIVVLHTRDKKYKVGLIPHQEGDEIKRILTDDRYFINGE